MKQTRLIRLLKLSGQNLAVFALAIVVVPSVSLSQIGPIEAQLLNDGVDHVGELITITDAIPVSATHCGFTWADYACEVSDPSGPIDTTCSIQDTLFVVVGDQFEINTQTLELCLALVSDVDALARRQ